MPYRSLAVPTPRKCSWCFLVDKGLCEKCPGVAWKLYMREDLLPWKKRLWLWWQQVKHELGGA